MATLGRPPVKKQLIMDVLRGRIVSGELRPGERLPTRRELSEYFGGTLTTVQQAMNSLERDGVVVSKGNLGTFVAENPPHLTHFALVFPVEASTRVHRLYWDHLAAVGRQVVREQGVRLTVYAGIDKEHPGEDYHRLLEDVRNDQIAGILFANSPFLVYGTDITERPGIPRVAMGAPKADEAHIGHVVLDGQGFAVKAVSHMKAKGVRRAAILAQPGHVLAPLLRELAEAGIDCPYHYQQAVVLENAAWAKNVMRLMFDAGNTTRPDGLIIMDDNFFDPALAGILDSRLNIPDELAILTHSNFPWQVTCPVDVKRLGYDMHQLLQLSLAELESQRHGDKPQTITLPAVFEEELPYYAQYQTRIDHIAVQSRSALS